MKLRIYSELENIPPVFYSPIVKYPQYFDYVNDLKIADFVAVQIHWEVIYDYSEQEFANANVPMKILPDLKQKVQRLIEKAQIYKKPILIVFYRDSFEEIPIENSIVFRTSILKSQQEKNIFALPACNGDIQKDFKVEADKLWLKKTTEPKVGFRGRSANLKLSLIPGLKEKWNSIADHLSIPFQLSTGWIEGYTLRRKAIINLLKNPKIKLDFSIVNIDGKNEEEINLNRQIFCDNILNNHYNICVKGHGNYSFRFYETLSAGRIPVFINTDCALPYDFIIDWKKYCVWVESKDINKLDQLILEFHNKFNDDEFIQLQKDIRKLWEDWISSEGFIRNFHKHFIH